MKLIIHDIEEVVLQLILPLDKNIEVIDACEVAAPCQGCFKCWLKNAGYCVIKDRLQHIGATIGNADEVIIISKLYYGGYSSHIKRVIDRSIGTSLPFFTYRGKQTHHMRRYSHKQIMRVYFYGEMSEFEKEVAIELVEMNRINMGIRMVQIFFVRSMEALMEAIL